MVEAAVGHLLCRLNRSLPIPKGVLWNASRRTYSSRAAASPYTTGASCSTGPTIAYAGPTTGAPATPGARIYRVTAVLPGLWDCHAHFMGVFTPDLAELATNAPALTAMRVARDAAVALRAGFTSVREVGGLGVWVARAVAEGTVKGPNVFGAGAILSPTGGHADLHMYPVDWVCDLADRIGMLRQCDGVPECLRAVRLQLRDGARLIKVCASGGVMSQIDDPIHQQFSHNELRAIVEEAGQAERIVAAHCHGKPGIMAALEAGVRTIEHGTYLDDECAEAMRECDAVLVPTRLIVEEFLAYGAAAGLPDYAQRKLLAVADRHARGDRNRVTNTGCVSQRGLMSADPAQRPQPGGVRTVRSSATSSSTGSRRSRRSRRQPRRHHRHSAPRHPNPDSSSPATTRTSSLSRVIPASMSESSPIPPM